jgi:hypothetical protein
MNEQPLGTERQRNRKDRRRVDEKRKFREKRKTFISGGDREEHPVRNGTQKMPARPSYMVRMRVNTVGW